MAGLDDKIAGKAQEIKGKVTDDERDEAEGKARQARGEVKDKVADTKKRVEYEVEKRV